MRRHRRSRGVPRASQRTQRLRLRALFPSPTKAARRRRRTSRRRETLDRAAPLRRVRHRHAQAGRRLLRRHRAPAPRRPLLRRPPPRRRPPRLRLQPRRLLRLPLRLVRRRPKQRFFEKTAHLRPQQRHHARRPRGHSHAQARRRPRRPLHVRRAPLLLTHDEDEVTNREVNERRGGFLFYRQVGQAKAGSTTTHIQEEGEERGGGGHYS
mmetsp:Transcript_5278/g.16598  ORF Transcript_5278/g.16598 Transcript_5278/m.16598 type:complete len:210 (+) Transcript_5278:211-840(+)